MGKFSNRPRLHRGIFLVLVVAGVAMSVYDLAVAGDHAASSDTHKRAIATLDTGSVCKLNQCPRLKLEPQKLEFGKVIATLNSAAISVVVTNKSKSVSVSFESIVAAPPFQIESDGCSGALLAAGNRCQVGVEFHPTSIGKIKDKAGLTFTDSASRSPQKVELRGEGVTGPTPMPTPTATATPTPTGSMSPTPTSTASCTPEEQPTPYVAGMVLIAGGQGSDGTPLSSAEVFNPKTNTFTLTTDPSLGGTAMNDSRYRHAAAVANDLPDPPATVLLSGGIDATGATSTTETFTSSTNQFTAGSMSVSREGHTETGLLGVHHTHSFLVAGGEDAAGTVLNSAEVPPPAMMNVARVNAAASTLQTYNPSVRDTCTASNAVITGGFDGISALQSAEVYNTTLNTFTLTDNPSLGGSQMNAARMFHTATPLGIGVTDVLVAGGENAAGVAQSTAEIFNPVTNKFTLTIDLGGTNMTVARAMHTATLYTFGGSVLIAGGMDDSGNVLATAEVFNVATETFTAVGSMHTARFNHAAAALSNGKILITGGEDGSGNTLNTAEIFDPTTNMFTLTTDPSLGGNNMNVARKLHTATAY